MRLLLLLGILLSLLSPVNAQLVPGLIKARPTAVDVDRPGFLVQIVVDRPPTPQEIPIIRRLGRVSHMTDWGTGALVDPQHVLTCKHNVSVNHTQVTVLFKNGDQVDAEVLARHPSLDILLLKLDKVRYEQPAVLHPDVQQVRSGQTVKAIGFPGDGVDDKPDAYEGDVQPAIFNVAGINRALFRYTGMATTGVSGGPVLVDGKIVGVLTGSYEGLGIYCVNTHPIRAFLERLK